MSICVLIMDRFFLWQKCKLRDRPQFPQSLLPEVVSRTLKKTIFVFFSIFFLLIFSGDSYLRIRTSKSTVYVVQFKKSFCILREKCLLIKKTKRTWSSYLKFIPNKELLKRNQTTNKNNKTNEILIFKILILWDSNV